MLKNSSEKVENNFIFLLKTNSYKIKFNYTVSNEINTNIENVNINHFVSS